MTWGKKHASALNLGWCIIKSWKKVWFGSVNSRSTCRHTYTILPVLDWAALEHMLKPNRGYLLYAFWESFFISYVKEQFQEASRIDIVWRTYLGTTIKNCTWKKQGDGRTDTCWRYEKSASKMGTVFRNSGEKTEWFKFHARYLIRYEYDGKTLVIAWNDHEEADTRMLLHLINGI